MAGYVGLVVLETLLVIARSSADPLKHLSIRATLQVFISGRALVLKCLRYVPVALHLGLGNLR